jgi:hypothetical protein
MDARRVLILIAVLLGVSALAAGLAPPPERTRSPVEGVVPSPTAADEADPDIQVVSAAEENQSIEAEAGRRLRIEVTSDRYGSVQLGADGPIESVQPGSPAHFDLLPDRPGEQDLVFLEPRRVIATVTIR